MKLQVDNLELLELTESDLISFNGGESAWYWVAYGSYNLASNGIEFGKYILRLNAKCDVSL